MAEQEKHARPEHHLQHHPEHHHHPQHHKARRMKMDVRLVGAVIVLVVILYFVFSSGAGSVSIGSPTKVNVSSSGTVFQIGQKQYVISLASASPGSGVAYVYISAVPLFLNPLQNVTLYINNITKVNPGSMYANIGLELDAISSNSAIVKITPLDPTLKLQPDSKNIRIVQGYLFSLSTRNSTLKLNVTTTSTSTIGSTSTSTSTIQGNVTLGKIMATLQKSLYYPLMLNYTKLYGNTTNCTPSLYNSTWTRVKGGMPFGQYTYTNISQFIPYRMYYNITSIGGGNYSVVWKTNTKSSLFNNAAALTLKVNVSQQTLIGTTFNSGGIYGPSANYTTLNNGYKKAVLYGTACGIYLV